MKSQMFMKRKKLRKLSPLSAMKRKAWDCFSLRIKERDKWTCFTCGKVDRSSNTHAGHFVHLDSMDFVKHNVHAQCVSCNQFKSGNLGVYAVKLDKKYGTGTAEHLIEMGKQYRGLRRTDYEKVIELYA